MMRNATLLIGLFAPLMTGCVSLSERYHGDDWSRDDTRREIAYQIVNAWDVIQTNEIRRRPDVVEVNPLGRAVMGAEPQPKDMAMYFGSLAVSHYAISRLLPAKLRKYWQSGTIASQGYTVANNCFEYKLGC